VAAAMILPPPSPPLRQSMPRAILLLGRHRRQLEHASKFRGFGNVAATQSKANRFEFCASSKEK
jgi:hypothetical protein